MQNAVSRRSHDHDDLHGDVASVLALDWQTLTHNRLLIRALIDQIPDFLFVKNLRHQFVLANRAITEAYGMTKPDDLIGKTDFDLHPRDAATTFFDFEHEVIISGSPMRDMEETFPDSRGVQKWYSTTKIPLRDHNDEVVGLIGVARDITERKLMDSLRHQQSLILEKIAGERPAHHRPDPSRAADGIAAAGDPGLDPAVRSGDPRPALRCRAEPAARL